MRTSPRKMNQPAQEDPEAEGTDLSDEEYSGSSSGRSTPPGKRRASEEEDGRKRARFRRMARPEGHRHGLKCAWPAQPRCGVPRTGSGCGSSTMWRRAGRARRRNPSSSTTEGRRGWGARVVEGHTGCCLPHGSAVFLDYPHLPRQTLPSRTRMARRTTEFGESRGMLNACRGCVIGVWLGI